MAVAQSTGRMQRAILSVVLFFALLFLALWGLDASVVINGVERCPYQFPKWLGCVIANHETLSGSLITVAGALFAAWIAWQAVIDQIKSDKELARNAQRAIVHGGPGNRIIENGIETKVVFSGQNTGTSPAFTKKIYWGVCKKSEWLTVSRNWIDHAKQHEWEEILPPQMKPSERYPVEFTATPIPDDGEDHICFGRIVYTDLFGREFTTSWKHSVVRDGKRLKTYGLPGGYSSEWQEQNG